MEAEQSKAQAAINPAHGLAVGDIPFLTQQADKSLVEGSGSPTHSSLCRRDHQGCEGGMLHFPHPLLIMSLLLLLMLPVHIFSIERLQLSAWVGHIQKMN